jgi:hypothetical protein
MGQTPERVNPIESLQGIINDVFHEERGAYLTMVLNGSDLNNLFAKAKIRLYNMYPEAEAFTVKYNREDK